MFTDTHVSGLNQKEDSVTALPKYTRLVGLLCDYLNHGLAKMVWEGAECLGPSSNLLPSFARAVLQEADDFIENGDFSISSEDFFACCRICSAHGSHSAHLNIEKTKRQLNAD